jgi:hypothetical protein
VDDGGRDGERAVGHGARRRRVLGFGGGRGEGQRLEEVLAVELDAVALVGADQPVGGVGGGLVEGRVGGRVGLDGEALLVRVVDGFQDFREGGREGAQRAPL